jgi:hypothetical protein
MIEKRERREAKAKKAERDGDVVPMNKHERRVEERRVAKKEERKQKEKEILMARKAFSKKRKAEERRRRDIETAAARDEFNRFHLVRKPGMI